MGTSSDTSGSYPTKSSFTAYYLSCRHFYTRKVSVFRYIAPFVSNHDDVSETTVPASRNHPTFIGRPYRTAIRGWNIDSLMVKGKVSSDVASWYRPVKDRSFG